MTGGPKKTLPQAVIVKVTSYRVCDAVLKACRKLKGSGLAIVESLTASNQELLWSTKNHQKVTEAQVRDGRIIALVHGSDNKHKKLIREKNDLDKL